MAAIFAQIRTGSDQLLEQPEAHSPEVEALLERTVVVEHTAAVGQLASELVAVALEPLASEPAEPSVLAVEPFVLAVEPSE